MSLKDVFCQDKAIELFQRSLRMGRLHHAYIFAGPEGVGRFKMAVEWAKVLLCKNRLEFENDGEIHYDSCGHCESCLLLESEGHPDFKHIYKELIKFTKNTQNRNKTPIDLPRDVIQEFLIDQVANKPKIGDRVVYIVNEAERLNASSQNLLLKTLEEPPAYCLIILLCTRLDKLLPTTLSRCQVVRFGSIDEDMIVEKLREQGCDAQQALYWARFTDGSLGQSYLYSALNTGSESVYEMKRTIVSDLANLKLETALDLAEKILGKSKTISKALAEVLTGISSSDINRRALKFILNVIMTVFSDSMKLALDHEACLVNEDQKGLISKITGTYGPENSIMCVQKTYESVQWVDSSVNERLIFEEILLKLVDFATI